MNDARGAAKLSASRAKLHSDVEMITGMDGAALLYDSRSKKYTRVGTTASKIISLAAELPEDTTIEDLVEILAKQNSTTAEAVWTKTGPLFEDLDARGCLIDSEAPDGDAQSGEGFQLIRRYPMVQNPARLLGPINRVFVSIPSAVCAVAAGVLLLAAVISLATWLPSVWDDGLGRDTFIAAAVALIFTTAIHEAAHAALMVRYGTPPREAGVGMLFGFLPIAYVDRSDTYRIVERRRRVLVSLAGPLSDLFLAGCAAFAARFATGSEQQFLSSLAILLSFVFIVNLNPILPTDGAHALEAATGQLNVHSKAFTYVFGRFVRSRAHQRLKQEPRRTRAWYVIVVLLSTGWLLLIIAMMVQTVIGLGISR